MAKNSYHVHLPFLLEGLHFDQDLTVDEFEKISSPIIDQAVKPIKAAMKKAGVRKGGLGLVLLAGGSSQLPGVKERVYDLTGVEPKRIPKDLMLAISYGAAFYHRRIFQLPMGEGQERILGEGLGIKVYDKGLIFNQIMLQHDQKLPAYFEKEYHVFPGDEQVTIELLKGNDTDTELNDALRTRTLTIRQSADKIKVRIEVDRNKIIRLEAYDPKDMEHKLEFEVSEGEIEPGEISRQRKRLGISGVSITSTSKEIPEGHPCVGIDIGTTTSEISYMTREGEKPEGLDNPTRPGYDSRVYPSVVFFEDGHKRVETANKEAMNALDDAGSKVFARFKIADRDKPIGKIGRKEITVSDLTAYLLARMWGDLCTFYGSSVQLKSAVITVPSAFGPDECQDTVRAAYIAGLQQVHLIDEPTAAFEYYKRIYPDIANIEKNLLVFDFGGGTSDVSILKLDKDNEHPKTHYRKDILYEVLATASDLKCGGEDIDLAIASYLREKFEGAGKGRSLEGNSASLRRLKVESERAKIELSDIAAGK